MFKAQPILSADYEHHSTKQPTIAELPCNECFLIRLDSYLKCNLSVIMMQLQSAPTP
jgi:hypothetical protein